MQSNIDNFLAHTNQEEFLQVLERRCQESDLTADQTCAYLASVRQDMELAPIGDPATTQEALAVVGRLISIQFALGEVKLTAVGLDPSNWSWSLSEAAA